MTTKQTAPVRVLVVSYFFPPIIAVAANRTVGFAKELKKLGAHVIVLTVRNARNSWIKTGSRIPDGIEVSRAYELPLENLVEIAQALLVRLCRIIGIHLTRNPFRELVVPDLQYGWLFLLRGLKLAKRIDVIYVSCSPFSSALGAVFLKSLTKKPLVVDFRDPFTHNPYESRSSWFNSIATRLERLIISRCDRLILNTEGTLSLYREFHPENVQKFVVIPNGFDSPIVPKPEGEIFRVMHVGNFYGNRQPDMLLDVLAELQLPDTEFVQVGNSFDCYELYKDRINITIIPHVDPAQALELMASASMFYLRQGYEPKVKNYIQVAAKTYEYLSSGLPILCEAPVGDNTVLVERYCPRPYLVTPGNRSEMKRALINAFGARSSPRPAPNAEFISRYSREQLAHQLFAEIRSLLPAHATSS